jgi:hypothetical protein
MESFHLIGSLRHERAIGQHTVHIHQEHFYAAGFFPKVTVHD